MRSEADFPCGHPAARTVLGVPLCERCSREQEAYFAVGELSRVPRGWAPGHVAATRAARTRQPRADGGRRGLWARLSRARGITFLAVVAVAASVFATAACGATEQARAGTKAATPEPAQKTANQEPEATTVAKTEGGDVEARAGGARAGGAWAGGAQAGGAEAGVGKSEARAGGVRITGDGITSDGQRAAGGSTEGSSREVTLAVTGEPGTRFAGSCSVGGEEKVLSGEAPERYAFEPRGKRLACEVRNEGAGTLGIAFDDGGSVHSEQSAGAGESTMRFVYSGGNIVSASTSSGSVQQKKATVYGGYPSGDRD